MPCGPPEFAGAPQGHLSRIQHPLSHIQHPLPPSKGFQRFSKGVCSGEDSNRDVLRDPAGKKKGKKEKNNTFFFIVTVILQLVRVTEINSREDCQKKS